MMNAFKSRFVGYLLRKNGFRGYTIKEKLYRDLFENDEEPWSEKWRWYKRGFLTVSKKRLQLTEDNYGKFVPDLPYARAYPVNDPILKKAVEDKLSYRYFFEKHARYLPRYLAYISAGDPIPLVDWNGDSTRTEWLIPDVLMAKGAVALKKIHGSQGKGFVRLSYDGGKYRINEDKVTLDELCRFIGRLDQYLATEYIRPHDFLRRFNQRSTNSVRLTMLGGYGVPRKIVSAILRIGTNKSGEVDNLSAGALLCGIDLEDGRLHSPLMNEGGEWMDCPVHPDSGARIEGTLPHWHLVRRAAEELFEHASFLRIAGFDMVVTGSGVKVLEINGHPELRNIQVYTPLLQGTLERTWFTNMFRAKGIEVGVLH